MKKVVASAVVLVAVSGVSFWFGQRSGMEDFSECLASGGLPVGAGEATARPAGEAIGATPQALVGQWRSSSDEALLRTFLPDGSFRDSYNGESFDDELGSWKISSGEVVLGGDDEQEKFKMARSADGASQALIDEAGETVFVR